jgi:deoxyribonuclease-4
MRFLGGYVSCAGGLFTAIERGEALGVNTIMLHPSPPQKWCTKPFDPEQIKKFNEKRKASNIKKVHLHNIYLINLANPDKQKFHLSKMAVVEYLNLAEQINAEGVVFHTGSFKDIGEKEGYERIAFGINWIFEHVNSAKPIFLEMAAGSGNVVGDKIEEVAKIKEMAGKFSDRVQFCLDTQHMFASGYDLVNDLENIVSQIEKVLGLENVRCIHFNDSKTDLASNKDRHENLGAGKIGPNAMQAFLNHPKLKDKDFVLETPNMKDSETAKTEITKLKEWAK